jgi:hypothetical protein
MGKLGKESGKMTIFTTSGHSGILNLERERERRNILLPEMMCIYIYNNNK